MQNESLYFAGQINPILIGSPGELAKLYFWYPLWSSGVCHPIQSKCIAKTNQLHGITMGLQQKIKLTENVNFWFLLPQAGRGSHFWSMSWASFTTRWPPAFPASAVLWFYDWMWRFWSTSHVGSSSRSWDCLAWIKGDWGETLCISGTMWKEVLARRGSDSPPK